MFFFFFLCSLCALLVNICPSYLHIFQPQVLREAQISSLNAPQTLHTMLVHPEICNPSRVSGTSSKAVPGICPSHSLIHLSDTHSPCPEASLHFNQPFVTLMPHTASWKGGFPQSTQTMLGQLTLLPSTQQAFSWAPVPYSHASALSTTKAPAVGTEGTGRCLAFLFPSLGAAVIIISRYNQSFHSNFRCSPRMRPGH